MNVLMVRSKVKEESVADAEAAVEKMFAAIEQAQPEGVHYASCKLADGVTFVALLQLDEGVENPLPALPEFREFVASLEDWRVDGPPIPEQLTVVGSYGLFG
jgi:hypothetical protein